MPFSALIGPIIGSVAGGLLGGGESGNSQNTTREPWGPSQDWLKDLIKQGQGLNGYYQQNPMNAVQQQGYANVMNDADGYRNQLLPALMGLSNNFTSGANFYDRSQPNKKPVGFNMPTNFTPQANQAAGDNQFLQGLYQSKLGKAPDEGGLAYWNQALQNGASRDAVSNEFERVRSMQSGGNYNPNRQTGLLGGTQQQTAQAFQQLNPYGGGGLLTTAQQAAMQPQPNPRDAYNQFFLNDFGGGGA